MASPRYKQGRSGQGWGRREESSRSCRRLLRVSKLFVHLHNHSEYSLLDGAGRIKDLVSLAAAQGMPALALTDHGVMYGVLDFYKQAQKQGVKPIIGCEVYVAKRSRHDRQPQQDDTQYHLVLLAENNQGYQNLLQLVSRASLEGFYYKPRVDRELLSQYSGGLIALSACLAGEIPELLLAGQDEKAMQAAGFLRDVFGSDSFFIELQDHGLPEQRLVNPKLVELAGKINTPLVATNDVHYCTREQARLHEVLLCIQTGKTLQDEKRLRFATDEFYLKSAREMAQLFADVPQALDHTLTIAERCNVSFSFGELHLPRYEVPPGETLDSYLAGLCWEGLAARGLAEKPAYRERLEYELQVINQMGFSGYFLIVWDVVNFAHRQGIPTGPGRGSAAGSLVAYVLGITQIDPLEHDLLFERFLNPERVTMPDIDIDFCFVRREEIIEYLARRYGSDRVAQIITFGTMAARAAVRDVGRVLNMPLSEVDRIAKMVPTELGITLARALEVNPELAQACRENSEVAKLIEIAQGLEGMPRHASTHAAGVVIGPEPLVNFLPLQRTTDSQVSTQFPMQTVEEIGMLKMDILGLRTLTVIGDALELIARRGVTLDISQLPLDDPKTYDMLCSGESTGVFQLESPGMRNLLKSLRPDRFQDLVALVALYRPGPLGSGMVEDFIQRKAGTVPVTYLHSGLEPILADTYGVILYQEQVMRIASDLAGFTLGQADLLRRAMGKKKPEVLSAQRANFVNGAMANGVDAETAGKIFDLMEYFAGYGFNRSHSAAYALVAYQTAFLKANYPVEFMAALLSSVMDNSDKVPVYIDECRRMGIAILPPDVNESQADFTVVPQGIRFGLGAVKNVGRVHIDAIIEVRDKAGPFTSLVDFCRRVDLGRVNKRVIESLINCGAFDSLGAGRKPLVSILDRCLELGQQAQNDRRRGQRSLFAAVEESQVPVPEVEDYSRREMLALEKELLGFYVSGHPAQEYRGQLEAATTHLLGELGELEDETSVTVGGVVAGWRKNFTKKNETMAYVTLEDTTGAVEVVLFPRTYAQVGDLLGDDVPLVVEGRVDRQEERVKIVAERVQPLSEVKTRRVLLQLLRVPGRDFLQEVKEALLRHPGPCPVYIYFPTEGKAVVAGDRFRVRPGLELQRELEELAGKGSLQLQ
ncbi:MAG: DNA polymerase III subunit alpha [Clostridia bacterium]|nr:MAG: DNA polymerase III subunit alpha [Clostridia bacterium]